MAASQEESTPQLPEDDWSTRINVGRRAALNRVLFGDDDEPDDGPEAA